MTTDDAIYAELLIATKRAMRRELRRRNLTPPHEECLGVWAEELCSSPSGVHYPILDDVRALLDKEFPA
jgi:hypothetical protein